MKTYFGYIFVLLGILALSACQSSENKTAAIDQPVQEETGNPLIGEDARAVTERNAAEETSQALQVPVLASPDTQSNVVGDMIVAYAPPPVGTEFSFKSSRKGQGSVIRNSQVTSHEGSFNGIRSWITSNESRTTHFDFTYNRLGRLDADKKVIESFSKRRYYYKFPMKPGDSWTTNWRVKNFERGRSFSGHAKVTVGNWETVTVGAGTFKVLPVTAKGILGSNFQITNMFSPELGVVVKGNEKRRNFWTNSELISYKRGSGTLETTATSQ